MLLNFQKRFTARIESGDKTHTIRAKRKRAPKVGDICHCYTGLRQKGARLLGRWRCVKVEEITIFRRSRYVFEIRIDSAMLSGDEREALAIRDGFESFGDMMRFWEGRLPFFGDIIHWDFRQPVTKASKRPARRITGESKPGAGRGVQRVQKASRSF